MHTPIDFPGFTTATIYANSSRCGMGRPRVCRRPRWGVLPGMIFVRQRRPSYGSDVPNYPNVSWSPPVSSQSTKLSPCRNWPGDATTFVEDQFWKDVRSVPLADRANPCTFKHYIWFNHFVQLPGSLPIYAVRDDGTYPARSMTSFSIRVTIFRNHPLWAERSTSFLYGNTFENYGANQRKYRLNFEPTIAEIQPGSFWPRDPPDQYPRVMDDLGEELPPWFKL